MDRNPISKAIQALTWMLTAPSENVGVREMALGIKVSPSTAHRLFAALADEGLVRQDAKSGRYSLGLGAFRLGQLAVSRVPLRQIAIRYMTKLVEACNETAVLGLYDDARREMIFAASVESPNSLRYVLELNAWMPIHAGASGLAILAFLPEQDREAVKSQAHQKAVTDRTLTDPARLENEVQKIRSRGYAITRGQRIPGAVGIAAPLMGPGGRMVGDVCLTIPEQRFKESTEKSLASLLLQCTGGICLEIGGQLATMPARRFAARSASRR